MKQEENINKNNINVKDNDIDNLKDQRDIIKQIEKELNLSMNQMNELAGKL